MKKIIGIAVLFCLCVCNAHALYYGIPCMIPEDSLGGVVIFNGETPFPAGAIFPVPVELRNMPKEHLKVVNGKIAGKTTAEKEFVDLPSKYKKLVDGKLVEMTAKEKTVIDTAAETVKQNAKSVMLKQIENLYVTFLTNDWTGLLREKGIIGKEETITVGNTDSTQNILYLMKLREMDRDSYIKFASEFKLFEDTLKERLGSTTGDCSWHQDIVSMGLMMKAKSFAVTAKQTVNKQRTTQNYTGLAVGGILGVLAGLLLKKITSRKPSKSKSTK